MHAKFSLNASKRQSAKSIQLGGEVEEMHNINWKMREHFKLNEYVDIFEPAKICVNSSFKIALFSRKFFGIRRARVVVRPMETSVLDPLLFNSYL